ncbi:MAG: AIR synthase family protein [Candidatus Zixiibacteriota bacterium]
MAELPEIGKISAEIFEELIYPRLGAKSKSVLVGPMQGTDCGIVEIGNQAVALTTDPVFIVPEYGWKEAAWFAIHILLSDEVTSGLNPTYLSIDLNLPMEMTKQQLGIVWDIIHKECEKYGVAVVCGHTARYENCHYPMVGGATVIGVGKRTEFVTPQLINPGDQIIITKGPAIEATGILATMFPKLIEREFGLEFFRRAKKVFWKMSVVEDAFAAISVGVRENGVTAMHDATECGIWGALHELAEAASVGVRVEKERIVISDCVPEICGFFGIDPYASISEGTLIIACKENKAEQIVKTLSQKDIASSIVGEFAEPRQGMILIEKGKERALKHPVVDPFWRAFYDALKKYKTNNQ